jgi:formylmethanofuran dehydrogenase subunit E
MDINQIDQQKIAETINFHGHWCTRLAIGIRAAEWANPRMRKSLPCQRRTCAWMDAIQSVIG